MLTVSVAYNVLHVSHDNNNASYLAIERQTYLPMYTDGNETRNNEKYR